MKGGMNMKGAIRLALSVAMLCLCFSAAASGAELRGYVQPEVRLGLKGDHRIGRAGNPLARLEITSWLGSDAAATIISDLYIDNLAYQQQIPAEYDLREAYVDMYLGPVDLRFGKQIFAWGKADEINPTDNLNPQNLSDPTRSKSDRKIGVLSLKSDLRVKGFTLEAIAIPNFVSSKLPEPGSGWEFFEMPPGAGPLRHLYPENKIENSELGVKLLKSIRNLDISVSYFSGWDDIFTPMLPRLAVIQPHDPQFSEVLVSIPAKYLRTRVMGADLATAISDFGLWGEAGYFLTEDRDGDDPAIKNPYLQFVIGGDYSFEPRIKVNLQYLQEIITKIDNDAEREIEESNISRMGMGAMMTKAISMRIAKEFGDAPHTLELAGVYDFENKGYLFKPQFTLSPFDGVICHLGLNLFGGDGDSLFGRFTENNEAYLRVKYSF
jgi:hypothetical protein